jgi:hypothetical protein
MAWYPEVEVEVHKGMRRRSRMTSDQPIIRPNNNNDGNDHPNMKKWEAATTRFMT